MEKLRKKYGHFVETVLKTSSFNVITFSNFVKNTSCTEIVSLVTESYTISFKCTLANVDVICPLKE